MKGFRTAPQASKKDQMRSLEAEVKNMQMASNISQQMIKLLMQNIQNMSSDLGNAMNQLYELQYKYSAMQKYLNIPSDDLDKIINDQRLVDFNAASAKEDLAENLADAAVVGADSTVTITTTAVGQDGKDAGIFRSRLKLAECGVADLITALTGQAVGYKCQVKLNGLDHTVEILSVKDPTTTQPAVEATH